MKESGPSKGSIRLAIFIHLVITHNSPLRSRLVCMTIYMGGTFQEGSVGSERSKNTKVNITLSKLINFKEPHFGLIINPIQTGQSYPFSFYQSSKGKCTEPWRGHRFRVHTHPSPNSGRRKIVRPTQGVRNRKISFFLLLFIYLLFIHLFRVLGTG